MFKFKNKIFVYELILYKLDDVNPVYISIKQNSLNKKINNAIYKYDNLIKACEKQKDKIEFLLRKLEVKRALAINLIKEQYDKYNAMLDSSDDEAI